MVTDPKADFRTNEEAQIEQALLAFQAATGLRVCLKIMQPQFWGLAIGAVSGRHNLHRSAFCQEVKRTRNERCKECDLRAVPVRCEQEKAIFTHVCHAGAGEVILPVFVEDTLAAVAYVGQFRTGDDQPPELPLLDGDAQKQLMGLSLLLGAYLGERLRTPRFVSESSCGYRSEAIQRFLQKNLRENPSLPELAKHLGLSTTRTAHAVREATGSSFVGLRDGLRLERARNLLQSTYHKVAHVAAECGFSSTQYFHRFFRQQTGMTPLAFRRKHRTEV